MPTTETISIKEVEFLQRNPVDGIADLTLTLSWTENGSPEGQSIITSTGINGVTLPNIEQGIVFTGTFSLTANTDISDFTLYLVNNPDIAPIPLTFSGNYPFSAGTNYITYSGTINSGTTVTFYIIFNPTEETIVGERTLHFDAAYSANTPFPYI